MVTEEEIEMHKPDPNMTGHIIECACGCGTKLLIEYAWSGGHIIRTSVTLYEHLNEAQKEAVERYYIKKERMWTVTIDEDIIEEEWGDVLDTLGNEKEE